MKFYTPLLQGVRLLQGGTDIFWLLFWLKHLISILYGQTHTHNTAVINLCSTRRFYIKKFYQQQGGTFIRDWVRFYVFIHWSEAGTFIRDGYALFSQKFGQGYAYQSGYVYQGHYSTQSLASCRLLAMIFSLHYASFIGS